MFIIIINLPKKISGDVIMIKSLYKFIRLVLIVSLLIILFFSSALMFFNSKYSMDKISGLISGYLGKKIELSGISGNIINNFSLSGLSANDGLKSGFDFSAGSLKADYSLYSILRSRRLKINGISASDIKVNMNNADNLLRIDSEKILNMVKTVLYNINLNSPFDFSVKRINVSDISFIFSNFNSIKNSLVKITELKIIPREILFTSFYFELFVQMLLEKEEIIPRSGVKGEVDLNNQRARLFVEAERLKLSKFNWLTALICPSIKFNDGVLILSSVINYSRLEGVAAYGSAIMKSVAFNYGPIPHAIFCDVVNLNFNEDSIKINNSKINIAGIDFVLNGVITKFSSPNDMTVSLEAKANETSAEKYFNLVKTVSGGDVINNYYSTGALDVVIEITGRGDDYSKWDYKAEAGFRNVSIESCKIALNIEKINGKIGLVAKNINILEPITFNFKGVRHELTGWLKNINLPTYSFVVKKSSLINSGSNMAAIESNTDEDSFVTYEDDMDDYNAAVVKVETAPASLDPCWLRAVVSGNPSKHYLSLDAYIAGVAINGLYGLNSSKISCLLSARNNHIILKNINLETPRGFVGGMLDFYGFTPESRVRMILNGSINEFKELCDALKLGGVAYDGKTQFSTNLYGKFNELNGLVKFSFSGGKFNICRGGLNVLLALEPLNINASVNGGKFNARFDTSAYCGKISGLLAGVYASETGVNANRMDCTASGLNIDEFYALNKKSGNIISGPLNAKISTIYDEKGVHGGGTFYINDAALDVAKIAAENPSLKTFLQQERLLLKKLTGGIEIDGGGIKASATASCVDSGRNISKMNFKIDWPSFNCYTSFVLNAGESKVEINGGGNIFSQSYKTVGANLRSQAVEKPLETPAEIKF